MSIVDNPEEFETMLEGLDVDDEKIRRDNSLDLSSLGRQQLSDLAAFKAMRSDMIQKREALKKAIRIMDKRIEITLSAIKVLQTPS